MEGRLAALPSHVGRKPSSVTFVPVEVFVVFQRVQECSAITVSSFSENPVLSPHGLAFVKFDFEKHSVL